MKRLADLVLQSAKYCTEETDDGCVCCGVQYAGSGELCVRCQAPLELSRTVKSRSVPPAFVPVLGASGAGKTVYLGLLLDMLSKGAKNMKGLVTGAFSVALQEQTTRALESRRFPEKTPTESDEWKWVHCEVTTRKRTADYVDIVTPDIAGEAIASEIERPRSQPAIRSVIAQSRGLMVLCDSIRVRDNGLDEDLFAIKLASYLSNLHVASATSKKRKKWEAPVAIVFTKADACPEAREDPNHFANCNLPRLLQFCERQFARYRFFASSVVGSSATMIDGYGCRTEVPFHVEPWGIVEPLEWIIASS
ncbi:MAG: hypothetical protein ACC628_10235 [Pirellulaceae bacterium]